MTREEVIQGLQFTIEMFLFDPSTGETLTEPRNNLDKATIDACKGAIELLKQQPCEDCISREAALRHRHIIYDDDGIGYSVVRVDEIIDLPSVQPQPKRGQWVERYGEVPIYNAGGFTETERIGWICSECKELEPRIARFCPNCGADMREV